MKTAFVTSLGSVSADMVIKSLKRMGFRVVGCDIYPREWVADAYNVDAFYRAPYATDAEAYLAFVHKVCEDEKVDYMLPLIDLEVDLLNKNREWFEAHNTCLCMSPEKTLNICRNKKALADFISENCPSITTIPTVRLKDIKERPWEFPLVCKPYNGRSSQGLLYVHSEEEWERFVKTADPEDYIVQPYIKGSVVLAEVVRSSRERKAVAVIREELLRTQHGCGTTVYVYHDAKLEADAAELANALGIEGCVNFEFIRDDAGVYHFIECNPRFSAGVEFSCLGGYEMVINHMRCFMGKDIDPFVVRDNRYIARKYEEYVTCVETK